MNTYMTSAEYKALAREHLFGRYATLIGAIACVGLVSSIVARFLTPFFNIFGLRLVTSFGVQFVGTFVQYMFQAGFCYMYMKISCNQFVSFGDIFYGFRGQVGKVSVLALIYAAVTSVCMLPFDIWETMMLSVSVNGMLFLTMSLLGILGIAGLVWFSLTYSQVFFLLCDFPAYTTSKLMLSSASLIRGNKGRLFFLELSFIPMYLLGTLSLGVGFLWIIPYVGMTEAHFYLDTMRKHNTVSQYQ